MKCTSVQDQSCYSTAVSLKLRDSGFSILDGIYELSHQCDVGRIWNGIIILCTMLCIGHKKCFTFRAEWISFIIWIDIQCGGLNPERVQYLNGPNILGRQIRFHCLLSQINITKVIAKIRLKNSLLFKCHLNTGLNCLVYKMQNQDSCHLM